MSWSVCDPIRRAETAARGLTHTERLAVAWRLVEGVDDPEDFHQLDMFLGMTAEHCRDVRLEAAIAADREAFAEGNYCAGPLEGKLPAFLREELLDRAAATHAKLPDPEPGLRVRIRAALAKAGDWIARSDDTWTGSIIGGVCFAAAAIIGFISAGVLQ
ncbi:MULTISPECIES: hypothetical protein [unclassified Marinovum]|uniref:hypothetical protein n=1 Tax=unclassified Marinovum TaxID=2647166 RepID=UPI003EDC397C